MLFAVAVALLAWLATELGQWQFRRLDDRVQSNRVVSTNLRLPPAPVDEVLSTERAAGADSEWRRVTVHGTWDDQRTVVLKYQTRDSGSGADVVTPLRTSSGAAVLVDRGWIATDNSGAVRPDLPAVSRGQVTVTGWVRSDASGNATKVSDRSTRAISSVRIARVTPYPLYRGFVDLAQESPAPAKKLRLTELPDATSNGPHFFYGLQWWFFGALAIFGFCYLMWDEIRQRRSRRKSERPEHAAVDG